MRQREQPYGGSSPQLSEEEQRGQGAGTRTSKMKGRRQRVKHSLEGQIPQALEGHQKSMGFT